MNQLSLFQLPDGINVLPFDGEALFYPDFISFGENERYFKHIVQTLPFKQEKMMMYDKEVVLPRLICVCGDAYNSSKYPGVMKNPVPWTEPLLHLKKQIEPLAGVSFTHALFNLYRDGKDSVSWHRDNERYGGENPVIASLSLGAARIFQFRYHSNKKINRSVELTPGSLLIMKGKTQHFWEHQLPKTMKRIGQRINITFRVGI